MEKRTQIVTRGHEAIDFRRVAKRMECPKWPFHTFGAARSADSVAFPESNPATAKEMLAAASESPLRSVIV